MAVCHRRDAWQAAALAEVPFLAADAKGEDVFFSAASSSLDGRVLLTGYAAGAWARRKSVDNVFRRADQSGLSLSEYRLRAGFIHVPVPAMGSLNAADLHAMMHSSDMDAWSTGRSYDKPFCRRVLIEEGVGQEEFGRRKKAASVLLFDRRTFLSSSSLADFRAYLTRIRCEHSGFEGVFKRHCSRSKFRGALATAAQSASKATYQLVPARLLKRIGSSLRLNEASAHEPMFDFLFPWAIEHARQFYR